jgi:hypothetical protein
MLLIVLSAFRAQGQANEVTWFAFESVVHLNHSQSKELIEFVHAFAGDSILQYNDHNDRIIVAIGNSFSSIELINALNELGYYIADISHGKCHEAGEKMITNWYYQCAVFACENADVSLLKINKRIELTAEERLKLGEKRLQKLIELGITLK